MNARLALVKPDNSKITFYNSEHEAGGPLFLIHRRGNYKARLESWPQFDFEPTEGEYGLSSTSKPGLVPVSGSKASMAGTSTGSALTSTVSGSNRSNRTSSSLSRQPKAGRVARIPARHSFRDLHNHPGTSEFSDQDLLTDSGFKPPLFGFLVTGGAV